MSPLGNGFQHKFQHSFISLKFSDHYVELLPRKFGVCARKALELTLYECLSSAIEQLKLQD
jgi:hypothetical protein